MRVTAFPLLAIAGLIVSQAASADPAAPKFVAKSDGEIVAMVAALDQGEIKTASLAQKKELSTPVLELAKMIQQDHIKNDQEFKKLRAKLGIKPVDTTAVSNLRTKSGQDVTVLKPLVGAEFEKAFVQAMIDGHSDALMLFDDFLKTAQNEELKKLLTTSRQHIATHLQAAKNINVEGTMTGEKR